MNSFQPHLSLLIRWLWKALNFGTGCQGNQPNNGQCLISPTCVKSLLRNTKGLGEFGELPRRRQWHPTPGLLPGKSHGRRSLVGCSPWGLEESDTTKWLHFYFSLSCIGEGNGNPLQCSCLENPRDGGAWWAAVSGVTQSRTQLKELSSSSRQIWQFCNFKQII